MMQCLLSGNLPLPPGMETWRTRSGRQTTRLEIAVIPLGHSAGPVTDGSDRPATTDTVVPKLGD